MQELDRFRRLTCMSSSMEHAVSKMPSTPRSISPRATSRASSPRGTVSPRGTSQERITPGIGSRHSRMASESSIETSDAAAAGRTHTPMLRTMTPRVPGTPNRSTPMFDRKSRTTPRPTGTPTSQASLYDPQTGRRLSAGGKKGGLSTPDVTPIKKIPSMQPNESDAALHLRALKMQLDELRNQPVPESVLAMTSGRSRTRAVVLHKVNSH